MLNQRLKFALILITFSALGVFFGSYSSDIWTTIKDSAFSSSLVYTSSDPALTSQADNSPTQSLSWETLLPPNDQAAIERYQTIEPQSVQDITSQILRSIQASNDDSYQRALMSTDTVSGLENKRTSISGFIVPIDFYQDQSIRSLFLVPYFGACLHFPPPPPNQMIFAQLERGFKEIDIMQSYTLEGYIDLGLFEDPMGTSAYTFTVGSIAIFNGQPDDVRKH